MKKRDYPRLLPAAMAALFVVANHVCGDSYELAKVKGMEVFNGSAGAKDLLRKNGFVVADPAFKQIFEAYIKSPPVERPSEKNPRGSVLPSFITTDSAWHTYHVLLEEGVKEMEEAQAQRLLKFSRQLLAATKAHAAKLGSTADELAHCASIGLALQEAQQRQSLVAEEKRISEGLRSTGSAPIE